MRDLFRNQGFWNHSDNITATRQRCVGYLAHEADIAAAVDQTDTAVGQCGTKTTR
jgi:hypothetical protein